MDERELDDKYLLWLSKNSLPVLVDAVIGRGVPDDNPIVSCLEIIGYVDGSDGEPRWRRSWLEQQSATMLYRIYYHEGDAKSLVYKILDQQSREHRVSKLVKALDG